jgi:hypothetical protein
LVYVFSLQGLRTWMLAEVWHATKWMLIKSALRLTETTEKKL